MRQSNQSEYQIRINGSPVVFETMMSLSLMDEWEKISAENPNDFVDIVLVSTNILMANNIYGIMEKHFKVDLK